MDVELQYRSWARHATELGRIDRDVGVLLMPQKEGKKKDGSSMLHVMPKDIAYHNMIFS